MLRGPRPWMTAHNKLDTWIQPNSDQGNESISIRMPLRAGSRRRFAHKVGHLYIPSIDTIRSFICTYSPSKRVHSAKSGSCKPRRPTAGLSHKVTRWAFGISTLTQSKCPVNVWDTIGLSWMTSEYSGCCVLGGRQLHPLTKAGST